MVTIENNYFNVRQICESGQCFRLELLEEREAGDGRIHRRYGLPAFGKYLEIGQCGQKVTLSCSQEEYDTVWKTYFDLDEDYGQLISSIDPEDAYLRKAAEFGSGIRILRQDLWEMIISFIVSQQNHIGRIRRCIRLLCEKYGAECRRENGEIYYAFPTPESLAAAQDEELYECNLGYRSRYVREMAASVCRGDVDLSAVPAMSYEDAVKELQKLSGVGAKVANCICLFALHNTEAFPVDTHIGKVLREQYPDGFPFGRYAGYVGSLQQYIFYYDLMNGSQNGKRTLRRKPARPNVGRGSLEGKDRRMNKVTVLCYEKCSTCQKALKWLDAQEIAYEKRPIREENPTMEELRQWYQRSGLPLKRFFNTSGNRYKEMQLKDRLPDLSEEEQLALLATDGMLVKRPLLVTDNYVCPGFKESEWKEKMASC